jgi:hypothetical protein
MFKRALSIVCSVIIIFLSGCSAKKAASTGFLSDYSKLTAHSDTSYKYVPSDGTLKRYKKFIVDPVAVYFHSGSHARKDGIKQEDINDLRNYMHQAILKALAGQVEVVYQPGPGVARFRTALTDLKKSSIVQNVLPATKLIGSGLGGASLEAEILDSQTGRQIGAVIESQLGNRISIDGLSEWGDAKAIMDGWANRLRQRLDEAHGR